MDTQLRSVSRTLRGQRAGNSEVSQMDTQRSVSRRGQSAGHSEVSQSDTQRSVNRTLRGQSAEHSEFSQQERSVSGHSEVSQ